LIKQHGKDVAGTNRTVSSMNYNVVEIELNVIFIWYNLQRF
jgi:hypothetical protein